MTHTPIPATWGNYITRHFIDNRPTPIPITSGADEELRKPVRVFSRDGTPINELEGCRPRHELRSRPITNTNNQSTTQRAAHNDTRRGSTSQTPTPTNKPKATSSSHTEDWIPKIIHVPTNDPFVDSSSLAKIAKQVTNVDIQSILREILSTQQEMRKYLSQLRGEFEAQLATNDNTPITNLTRRIESLESAIQYTNDKLTDIEEIDTSNSLLEPESTEKEVDPDSQMTGSTTNPVGFWIEPLTGEN